MRFRLCPVNALHGPMVRREPCTCEEDTGPEWVCWWCGHVEAEAA